MWLYIIIIHIKTCKIFVESVAYIYSAAVIGKGAELKFPTNLLKSDIIAFFNNEKPSVNGVNLASND